jgi:hypothetical protein
MQWTTVSSILNSTYPTHSTLPNALDGFSTTHAAGASGLSKLEQSACQGLTTLAADPHLNAYQALFCLLNDRFVD